MAGIEGGAGCHTAPPPPFNTSTHMGARFLFPIYLCVYSPAQTPFLGSELN